MMTLVDIFIYFLIALVLAYFASLSNHFYKGSPRIDKYLWLYIIVYSILAGIRWNVGVDTLSYCYAFKYNQIVKGGTEYIWNWLIHLVYYLHLHWSTGLGIAAFFQIFFIVKYLRDYRFILIALPFVMIGGRYWADLMGAIRQMIVVCGFLWASKFIYERKLKEFLVFVFIGYFVHHTALFVLPFYFLPYKFKVENHRLLLIGILLLCFVIGQTPAFSFAASYIESIANIAGYENYTERVGTMLTTDYNTEALSFGPMMLSYLLIPISIIICGKHLERKYASSIPYFHMWYNYAYFYACGYFLVCNISHVFIRPMWYFSLFQLVMASLLLYDVVVQAMHNKRKVIAAIALSVLIATNTVWSVYKSRNSEWNTVTYKVFFTHMDQVRAKNL